MSRARALVSSEALALVAAICIVLIFLVGSWDRRLDSYDIQAQELAQQVQELIKAHSAKAPDSATPTPADHPKLMTLASLEKLGLKVPDGLKVTVPEGKPGKWQVAIWHPEGLKRFVVSPQGIAEQLR
jgi:hypothetical protein